jgi:hypothetical protein
VDQNDPARKLAQAAYDFAGGRTQAFGQALQELRPNATIIARAMELSLTEAPFTAYSSNREILNTYLRIALARENIDAQERIGRTVKWLNWILVALTAALVWFGWVDYHRHQVSEQVVQPAPSPRGFEPREPAFASPP